MSPPRFKILAKELTPPIIYKFLKLNLRRYHGKDGLDRKLEKYLNYRNGYFVELGANDGVGQSNTFHFEKYKNWRGVLIEPVPHNFLKCKENRSAQNSIYCAACVGFDFKEEFVKIVYSNLMSTSIGLESEILDGVRHANSGQDFLPPNEEVFEFAARARTLNELLVQAKAPSVMDLLSLDVEGAEMEVLKGIDHDQFKFKYICIECLGSPEHLDAFLSTRGYKFLERLSVYDYLYRLEPAR